MNRAAIRAAVTVFIAGTACSGLLEGDCTLIGCIGALKIAFASPPSVPFHVEAISVSHGVRTFDCADPTKCTTVQFDDYTPDQVVITVSTATGARQFNTAPSYENHYSNGKNCGVTCRTGTVSVALP